MISQRALTECVRLMPSLFRTGSYWRCAFTGTFLHPYAPESWAGHVEADQSTFTYAPPPFIPLPRSHGARPAGCLTEGPARAESYYN